MQKPETLLRIGGWRDEYVLFRRAVFVRRRNYFIDFSEFHFSLLQSARTAKSPLPKQGVRLLMLSAIEVGFRKCTSG
jgi:hypothetical protein